MTEPKKDTPQAKPAEAKKAAADDQQDYPQVDQDNPKVEVSAGVTPDAGGNDLLAAAQAKAPNLTAEFVKHYKLDDDLLKKIARGEEPPPPYNGPDFSATDLHLTPGGWQSTPAGVPPEDVGKNAIHRDA